MIYQIKFQKGELWNSDRPEGVMDLRVLSGKAWVTKKGSWEDIILSEGELLPAPQSGVLVQALTEELVVQGDFK